MASPGPKRPRDKVVEPTVPEGFGQWGTPEFAELNRDYYAFGIAARALDRVRALKGRHRDHINHYNAWQLIGDWTQDKWQYLASPLSLHAPVVPPSYGKLEAIERELVWLFSHPAGPSATEAAEVAVAKYQHEFDTYEHASKNGREVAGAMAKIGAMAPAAPFLAGGAPVVAGGVAALGAAAIDSAIVASEKSIEGATLSWRELAPEAVKSGGAAFLSVFVWAKLSPYLMTKLPEVVAAIVSDEQLFWIGEKLGRKLSRDQLLNALATFSAEFWANILSAGTATSFELTFDLLQSKQ